MTPDPTAAERVADISRRLLAGAAIVPHPNWYHGNIASAGDLQAAVAGVICEAEAAAFRRGAEAGKRQVAELVQSLADQQYCPGGAAERIIDAIAALPVPEDRP